MVFGIFDLSYSHDSVMPSPKKAQRNQHIRHIARPEASQSLPTKTNKNNGIPTTAQSITETDERHEQLSNEMLENGCWLISGVIHAKQDINYQLIQDNNDSCCYLDYWHDSKLCYFYNNNYSYNRELKAGSTTWLLRFCFTKEWLKKRSDLAKPDPGSAISKIINKWSTHVVLAPSPLQLHAFRELHDLFVPVSGSPIFELLLRKLAFPLIGQLFQMLLLKEQPLLTAPVNYRENIAGITKYINAHIQDGFPGLPFLARIGHMSTATMRRQFPLHIGCSAFQYYRYQQLNYALNKLQEPGSIKDISVYLGFNNPSNFTRLFREYYGISPAGFRKKLKETV